MAITIRKEKTNHIGKIVQLHEEAIKGQRKALVRDSVAETLNELLEAVADKLLKQLGMSALNSAKVTAAAIMTGILLLLPETSRCLFPNSRASHLKLLSLSGIPAGRAARKNLSWRCIWQAYPCGVCKILWRPCKAVKWPLHHQRTEQEGVCPH